MLFRYSRVGPTSGPNRTWLTSALGSAREHCERTCTTPPMDIDAYVKANTMDFQSPSRARPRSVSSSRVRGTTSMNFIMIFSSPAPQINGKVRRCFHQTDRDQTIRGTRTRTETGESSGTSTDSFALPPTVQPSAAQEQDQDYAKALPPTTERSAVATDSSSLPSRGTEECRKRRTPSPLVCCGTKETFTYHLIPADSPSPLIWRNSVRATVTVSDFRSGPEADVRGPGTNSSASTVATVIPSCHCPWSRRSLWRRSLLGHTVCRYE